MLRRFLIYYSFHVSKWEFFPMSYLVGHWLWKDIKIIYISTNKVGISKIGPNSDREVSTFLQQMKLFGNCKVVRKIRNLTSALKTSNFLPRNLGFPSYFEELSVF